MLSTIIELAGFAALTAGVYLLAGAGFALVAGGVILLAIGLLLSQPSPRKLVRVRVPSEALTQADLDAEPLTNGHLAKRG